MGLFDKLKNNTIITPDGRRLKTIEKVKKMKIAYNEHLPFRAASSDIKLKDVETVKKRALASMLSIQLACSINNGEDYGQSLAFVLKTMDEWNLSLDDFLPKERLLIENKHTKKECEHEFARQDLVDIAWTYEVYWVLIWALDLITDKELLNVSKICNTERAMAISSTIEYLYSASSLKLRNTEKILDMLDLFYFYHWACVEKRVRPETEIGTLNSEVVAERRRGLEWLVCEEHDWNNISLDT